MRALYSLAILAALLLVALVPQPASAALTSSWQIIAKDKGGNITNIFEADAIMNVTVLPPASLVTGSIRSLVVWSTTQSKELTRYSLGYYPSGANQSSVPKVLQINLGAFVLLIHGDTLLLQVRNSAETIEYTTAVTVNVDIDALLKQQRDLFYGLFGQLQYEMAQMNYDLGQQIETLLRYVELLAIIVVFLAAYTTRDKWYGKRKHTEQEKSDREFEQFLEAFIIERHSAGDKEDAQR